MENVSLTVVVAIYDIYDVYIFQARPPCAVL